MSVGVLEPAGGARTKETKDVDGRRRPAHMASSNGPLPTRPPAHPHRVPVHAARLEFDVWQRQTSNPSGHSHVFVTDMYATALSSFMFYSVATCSGGPADSRYVLLTVSQFTKGGQGQSGH